MLDCSFGFRPRRAAQDALQVVINPAWQGRRWVVETDIADCFSALPHSGLMSAVTERICDRRVLGLLGAFLRAGVLEDGAVRRPVSGTPQGGVLSPVLCNVYCTGWTGRGVARTGRWCGTPMICWWSAGPVGRPRPRWRGLECCWPTWGCSPRRPRRGSCTWSRVARGSTSSGSTIGWCAPAWSAGPAGWSILPLAFPQAAQHARDRIRLLTMRARLAAPVEQIVQEVNAFLRGWVGFFRYGNSAREFDKIRTYAVLRARCLSPSATSGAGHGGIAQVYRSPDSLGLIFLNGTVVAPRPKRPWRAPVEHRR
jgi:RNA-directed DNA polymerase